MYLRARKREEIKKNDSELVCSVYACTIQPQSIPSFLLPPKYSWAISE